MFIKVNFRNVAIVAVVLIFGYIAILIWSTDEKFPDVDLDFRDLAGYAILAATLGGNAVVRVNKERKLEISSKGKTAEGADDLLTRADLVSNHIILDVLGRYPGLDIITEEKAKLSESELEKYRDDDYYLGLNISQITRELPPKKVSLSDIAIWVDPLDATQEFTEGLLEYVTVMVCVAEKGQPIFGVIRRPFANETWFGLDGFGVMGANNLKWDHMEKISVSKKLVISRSHAGKVKDVALHAFGEEFFIEPAGGAGYKSLRLINGSAALYLHTTVIKKWDICAGDAMLRSIGGAVIDLTGSLLDYSLSAPVVNSNGIFAATRNPYTLYQKWRKASSVHR